MYPNVVWFNMVLRVLNDSRKRSWDSESPCYILHFFGVITKCVRHAVSGIFHWFMDSTISLIIFFDYMLFHVTNAVPNRRPSSNKSTPLPRQYMSCCYQSIHFFLSAISF